MSYESGTAWFAAIGGLGALAAVVSLTVVQTRAWQARSFQRFANWVDLRVSDPVITAAVTRRLRRTDTSVAVGALVGIAVAALAFFARPPVPLSTFIFVVALPIILIGITFFPVTLALRDQLYTPEEHAPRVARVQQLSMRDYLSPMRLWSAPLFTLLAAVLTILGGVLAVTGMINSSRFFHGLAPIALLVAIVTLGAGAWAARMVVGKNQSATDSLELAWSDAMRAETLRILWQFVTIIAWLAVVLAALGILAALEQPIGADGTGAVLNAATVWGNIIIGRFYSRGGAYNYFRYRLWPDLGDVGEIIDESDSASTDDSVEPEQRRP